MNYTIAYIDETDADIRSFKRSVLLRSNEKFNVIAIKPKPVLEDTTKEAFENHIDAVIADFRLSEEEPTVHYNGSDVIKEVLSLRKDFPVFILTSFEDDAIDKGFDVNIVYEKKDIQEDSRFFDRVVMQIKKHKAKIEMSELRIVELINKSKKEPLTSIEEEELIGLDALIEKSLDKRGFVPTSLKISSNSDRLQLLLDKANEIISEIKQKNKND